MRKNIFFATIGLITFSMALFVSCKKSNDNKSSTNDDKSKITAADSVALGYWFGSFINGGKINQSMLFTANGVVKVYDFYYYPTSTDTTIAYDGTGYWSVSGNALTVVDSFPDGEKFSSVSTLNLTTNPQTFTDNVGNLYTKQ